VAVILPRKEAVVFRRILVAYDGSPASKAAFEQAVDIARAHNSTLTVITVAPRVSCFVCFAGASSERMSEELAEWASRLTREAAESAPDDVILHTVERSGRVGEQIVEELNARPYDLVVLGSRGHGRMASRLLDSVNGYVFFRARTPLLSIAEPSTVPRRRRSARLITVSRTLRRQIAAWCTSPGAAKVRL
jgi:nucleotide-binding universal stress UspA family protein